MKKYIIAIMLSAIVGFAPAASAFDRTTYVPAVYTGSGDNQFELVGKRHKSHRHHKRSHRHSRHRSHHHYRHHHHRHYYPSRYRQHYYNGYPGYSPYYSPYRERYITVPGFGGFYRF